VEKTLEVLRFKYLKAYISYEGIQRVEKYLFPLQALREAILNAVVHKDYGSGIPVQISVYEDLFVIWNPGQLPEKWDMEKLLSKHPSQPYNPLLAAAFFRSGYIESWGRGIEKIYRECREHKNPAPIFDYDMSGLMLSFRAGEIVGEFVEGNGNFGESVENFGEKSGDFGENFGEKSQKVGENCDRVGEKVGENRDRVGEKLSLNQQKILDLLWEKPDMSAKKLALQLDISLRKTETNISRLKKLGLLRRVGPAKGGYWLVVKSG
jgi:ATP-dependent DNA helicase RecG